MIALTCLIDFDLFNIQFAIHLNVDITWTLQCTRQLGGQMHVRPRFSTAAQDDVSSQYPGPGELVTHPVCPQPISATSCCPAAGCGRSWGPGQLCTTHTCPLTSDSPRVSSVPPTQVTSSPGHQAVRARSESESPELRDLEKNLDDDDVEICCRKAFFII